MDSLGEKKASRWARELLSGKEFVVLDSETTGLKSPVGFVEVAVADPEGEPLINTTIRPKPPIEPGAAKVHGYTKETLADSPSFKDIYPDILDAIKGRRVVVYNARYYRRVFDTEIGMLGARGMLSGRYLPAWECAMGWYSQYVGEPGKRGGYKSQKLPGGDHSALGDCRATLKVLEAISSNQ
ncbi:3'-5' exonuclease [Rubrobacter aplysinae]|uniref:3'-5' exonuclease n=1 Tax=Rubrobacter aplysinae TaxID=909625 RepID=UPI00064BED56|nr:3'-5' exonuclease [Rubrobacter aplysinae]